MNLPPLEYKPTPQELTEAQYRMQSIQRKLKRTNEQDRDRERRAKGQLRESVNVPR